MQTHPDDQYILFRISSFYLKEKVCLYTSIPELIEKLRLFELTYLVFYFFTNGLHIQTLKFDLTFEFFNLKLIDL